MARPVRKTHATRRFPAQMKNIVKLPSLCLVLMRVRMVSRDRKLCLGLEGRSCCWGRTGREQPVIFETRLALMHPSGVQEMPPPFGRTDAALWGGHG